MSWFLFVFVYMVFFFFQSRPVYFIMSVTCFHDMFQCAYELLMPMPHRHRRARHFLPGSCAP